MFSSRFTWSFTTNRISWLLEAKRSAGIKIFDLTQSNPTQAELRYENEKIRQALSQPQALIYEPESRGLLSAREAVARYYDSRRLHVDPEYIDLTASTSEGYAYLFKLLANPGDEILIPQPSYPLFDFLTALESVELVPYPLKYDKRDGWQIVLKRLATSISTKTKAIVVVNPNNPTGSFLKINELEFLDQLCHEHDLALISDEVFSDYCDITDTKIIASLVKHRASLTFVLSGLSKICALPQIKLGWIHTNGPEPLKTEARERLDFIADTYLSTSTPSQLAAERLLALRDGIQEQIKHRLRINEKYLAEQLSNVSNCRLLKREGGWYGVIEIRDEFKEEDWIVRLLEEENVFVHPGYFFDFPREGFLVLSLLTPPAIFREGLLRITKRLAA